MLYNAVLPRILGAFFHYSPNHPDITGLIDCLPQLHRLYHWREPVEVADLCETVSVPPQDEFLWQFSMLFEGQGEMIAPPWGSVYLEKDNLLMGETTSNYREFLTNQRMEFTRRYNEPEDQFGLMLLAYAAFLECNNLDAAATLLEKYLLPWAPRYLELMRNNELSPFYAILAEITQRYLKDVQDRQGLHPVANRIFF